MQHGLSRGLTNSQTHTPPRLPHMQSKVQDNDVEEGRPDEIHGHQEYVVLLKHVLPGLRLPVLGSKVNTCSSMKRSRQSRSNIAVVASSPADSSTSGRSCFSRNRHIITAAAKATTNQLLWGFSG